MEVKSEERAGAKESIKQAFSNVKQDIYQLDSNMNLLNNKLLELTKIIIQQNDIIKNQFSLLNAQLDFLKLGISDMKNEIKLVTEFSKDLKQEIESINFNQKNLEINQKQLENLQKNIENMLFACFPAQNNEKPTIQQIKPAHLKIPAHNLPLYSLKTQNMPLSTGNAGVPSVSQSVKQTDNPAQNMQNLILEKQQKASNLPKKYEETRENLLKIASCRYLEPIEQEKIKEKSQKIEEKEQKEDRISNLERASEILESLDNLKKEVRLKLKRLTNQEFRVLSTIYQLEQEQIQVDYTLLATRLKLSESSIRDYISRIISKGVPILKEKLNNKQILLHISEHLKKIASLNTILQLREL